MKARRDYVSPLSKQAVAVLKDSQHHEWALSVPAPEQHRLHHAQSAHLRNARHEPEPEHDAALLTGNLFDLGQRERILA